MNKQKICPVCKGNDFDLIIVITEKPEKETAFPMSGSYYREILQCRNCRVYFNYHNYIADDFYQGTYNLATYQDKMLVTYQKIRSLPTEQSDNKQRVMRVHGFLEDRFQDKNNERLKILDVGSGLCVFLAEMKGLGYKTYCIDPDGSAIKHALNNVNVDFAQPGSLDSLQTQEKFELISFNKVLEHVEDPVELLSQAKKFLNPHGIVYVELPDGDAAIKYRADPKDHSEFFIQHITVFNQSSLKLLADFSGYKVLKIDSIRDPSGKFTVFAFLSLVN